MIYQKSFDFGWPFIVYLKVDFPQFCDLDISCMEQVINLNLHKKRIYTYICHIYIVNYS